MAKYYGIAARHVIDEFESVYNQILKQQADGKEITPALLYQLDSYWKAQGQLRQELQKLGEKQIATLTKIMEVNFFEVYYSIEVEGAEAFTTIDSNIVKQLINSIWVADGKSWSQRIWDNTEMLANTLNEELVACAITGKKTTELKNVLQERFSVSYNNADMLVRTEMAHVQTQAAQKRYEDYGVQEMEVWASPDERRCEVCGKLHKTRYPIGAQSPIPAHPRCRCCLIPVVEE